VNHKGWDRGLIRSRRRSHADAAPGNLVLCSSRWTRANACSAGWRWPDCP